MRTFRLLLTLLLAGCVPGLGRFGAVQADAPGKEIKAQSEAPQPLQVPKEQIESLSAGIISKNSSKFNGTVWAPPGILGKNASKYRIAGLGEAAVPDVYVYLKSPDGRFYAIDGRIMATRTDAKGKYDFGGSALPTGMNVFVTAIDADNRVLAAYTNSVSGENAVDLGVGSTCVAQFFKEKAQQRARGMETFDRAKLPEIVTLTQALLDRGDLAITGDLFQMGKASALTFAYEAAFMAKSPGLTQAWYNLLGPAPAQSAPTPVPTFAPVATASMPGI